MWIKSIKQKTYSLEECMQKGYNAVEIDGKFYLMYMPRVGFGDEIKLTEIPAEAVDEKVDY